MSRSRGVPQKMIRSLKFESELHVTSVTIRWGSYHEDRLYQPMGQCEDCVLVIDRSDLKVREKVFRLSG